VCKLPLSICKNIFGATFPSVSGAKNHFTVLEKRNCKHVGQSSTDVTSETSSSNGATLYSHLPSSCPCYHTLPALIAVPGHSVCEGFSAWREEESKEVMLETLYAYLHDNDESQLGCNDMPVVYVMLILVLVTRRVAEIPVSESSVGKSGPNLRHLCSKAMWPEDGARHVPVNASRNS